MTTITHAAVFALCSGFFVFGLCACSEPAEQLAAHFEALAIASESHKILDCKEDPSPDTCLSSRCQKLGDDLNGYLKQHTQAMGELMTKKGESSQAVSQRIYAASTRLDTIAQLCAADKGVATFKHALATLIKEKASLPPAP